MQAVHHPLKLPFQQQGEQFFRLCNSALYCFTVGFRRRGQYIVHNLIPVARVTNAYAQPVKITTPQGVDDIPQSIVPTMPTPGFEAYAARRQVEVIMDH